MAMKTIKEGAEDEEKLKEQRPSLSFLDLIVGGILLSIAAATVAGIYCLLSYTLACLISSAITCLINLGAVASIGAWATIGLTLSNAVASIGSWTVMAGVSFVGGVFIAFPLIQAAFLLEYLGLYTDLQSKILVSILFLGAAPAGAALYGLAVEPFLIVAALEFTIMATIAFFQMLDAKLFTPPEGNQEEDMAYGVDSACDKVAFPASSSSSMPRDEFSHRFDRHIPSFFAKQEAKVGETFDLDEDAIPDCPGAYA